ncbi:putative transcriptional regulator [Rhodococcus sp. AW25M09]|uniref:hypothetical protein n=1 Tax=Rhodococcus sp. AW25M09 TaxID=1268303 RepID=UPI0002ACBA54|nr:hypothetical protein [Rhodococcus sp. AW25M09]CCQ18072.1 putative transcriptional regulator [Rhodococcus sp. AW25M09]
MTDNMLDEAVIAGVSETDDLDWKSELPPMKGLPQTDFPKDVAAIANSSSVIPMILVDVSTVRTSTAHSHHSLEHPDL